MDYTLLTGLFIEGILSFISPCILPLVPLYIGYMTSDVKNSKVNVMINTNFFVLGISTVFFIMGLGVSSLKEFISDYQVYISIAGSIILVIFGLANIGLLKKFQLVKTIKYYPKVLDKKGPLNAYILGFFFSFAWSPCVGPYLANALLLASTASSSVIGNLYILAYALGFIIPFLIIGLFTEQALKLIKNHMNILENTVKIGGLVMILMGLYMGYDAYNQYNIMKNIEPKVDEEKVLAIDFTLEDQFGNTHSLSDYQGNYLMLQFVASWCKYCQLGYQDMIEVSKETGVPVLFMTTPNNGDISKEELIKYYDSLNIDNPVLFDEKALQVSMYGISGYPALLIINPDSTIYGFHSGALPKEALLEVINKIKAND